MSDKRKQKAQTPPRSQVVPSQKHVFKATDLQPDHFEGGIMRGFTQKNFPVLKGLAVFWLRGDKKSLVEPHWHPNADEITYCIKGKGIMSVVESDNRQETYEFGAGDLIFFPKGSFHYIESTGDEDLEFLVVFNNELPELIGINAALAGLPDEALGTTFKVPASTFENFEKKYLILALKK